MPITVQLTGNQARMLISGRFDSSVYQEYKQAYLPLVENPAIKTINVDISSVDYLDSGALGMLVQLDTVLKNAKKSLTLISVPGKAADVLKIANADKLFTINLPSGIKLDLGRK